MTKIVKLIMVSLMILALSVGSVTAEEVIDAQPIPEEEIQVETELVEDLNEVEDVAAAIEETVEAVTEMPEFHAKEAEEIADIYTPVLIPGAEGGVVYAYAAENGQTAFRMYGEANGVDGYYPVMILADDDFTGAEGQEMEVALAGAEPVEETTDNLALAVKAPAEETVVPEGFEYDESAGVMYFTNVFGEKEYFVYAAYVPGEYFYLPSNADGEVLPGVLPADLKDESVAARKLSGDLMEKSENFADGFQTKVFVRCEDGKDVSVFTAYPEIQFAETQEEGPALTKEEGEDQDSETEDDGEKEPAENPEKKDDGEEEADPTPTAAPTKKPGKKPTATPAPTSTPEPTATPEPAPTERVETRTESVVIEYTSQREAQSDMYVDEPERVVQEGHNGEKIVTYQVTMLGDEILSETDVGEEIVTPMVPEIIGYGVKEHVIEIKTITVDEEIPFSKVTVENPDLEEGKTNILQEGKAGKKTVYYNITIKDGVEIEGSREKAAEVIVEQPTDMKVEVGTKKVEQPEQPDTPGSPVEDDTPAENPDHTISEPGEGND